MQDRAAEGQALSPASGEIARLGVFAPFEASHLSDELSARSNAVAAQSVDAAEEPDVLVDRQSS